MNVAQCFGVLNLEERCVPGAVIAVHAAASAHHYVRDRLLESFVSYLTVLSLECMLFRNSRGKI